MRFEFGEAQVAQGRHNQRRSQETPTTFGRSNSAEDFSTAPMLDRPRNRMAGQAGERLLTYLNDQEEATRTDEWNDMFALSNEGAAFNQAKMNGGMLPEEGMG